MKFSIIVVAYKRPLQLRCLLYSLMSQTYDNFDVIIMHDGDDEEYNKVVLEFMDDTRFRFRNTGQRYNDWGHSLRNLGLLFATGDFVINTNDDNYYTPNWLMELHDALKSKPMANFVYYDMVMSHNNSENLNKKAYGLFKPKIKHSYIDVGQYAVSRDVIMNHKFGSKADSDGDLIEEIIYKLRPVYIDKILFVHN